MLPKTIKKVVVPAHQRDGEPVNQYTRSQLVNAEKEKPKKRIQSKEEFQSEYDQITNEFLDKNGDPVHSSSLTTLEKKIKDLYTGSSESGVDKLIFSDEDFLSTLYTTWNNITGDIPIIRSEPDEALFSLINKSNIEKTHSYVDDLEEYFKDEFGVDTERVDPFTFKCKVNQDVKISDEDLVTELFSLLGNDMSGLKKKNSHLLEKSSLEHVDEQSTLSSELREEYEKHGERKFNKSIGPSVILSNLGKYSNVNNPALEPKFATGNLVKFLSERGIDAYGCYVEHDPEALRKILTKDLAKSKDVHQTKEISDFFKNIDSGSLVPALNVMLKNSIIPEFMLKDKNVVDTARKMSDKARQLLSIGQNKSVDQHVYISKNPFNILTMAPEKHVPSCQSITDTGEIAITPFNVNIPASYNNWYTNDFVLYTLNKNNEKDARISLSIEPESEKIVSYEDFKVFGDNAKNRAIINSLFGNQGFDDRYLSPVVKPPSPAKTEAKSKPYQHIVTLSSALGKISEQFKLAEKSGNSEEISKLFDKVDAGFKIQQKGKNKLHDMLLSDMNNEFFDSVEESRSLMYGSNSFYSIHNGTNIQHKFAGMFSKVDKLYGNLHTALKSKISKKESE